MPVKRCFSQECLSNGGGEFFQLYDYFLKLRRDMFLVEFFVKCHPLNLFFSDKWFCKRVYRRGKSGLSLFKRESDRFGQIESCEVELAG